MYWRTPRSKPAPEPPPPIPAGLALMADEFADRPFRVAGEWAAGSGAPPPPAPVAPSNGLFIPRPNWEREAAERREREAESSNPVATSQDAPQGTAVEAMLAAEAEPPPPNLDPPMVYEPMRRPVIPEPDWRSEQAERERQEAETRAREERYARLLKLIDEEGT